MKRDCSICSLLGVTQHDMAMLLNVSRSLWSLYELGKRDLPARAMTQLAEMLAFVHAQGAQRMPAPQVLEKQQQQLEYMLRENEYQQLLLERKKAAVEKKQVAQTRLAQLTEFLNKSQTTARTAQRNCITSNASQLKTDAATLLMKYELKQELLILEKLMLESKMRKITKNIENIRTSLHKK